MGSAAWPIYNATHVDLVLASTGLVYSYGLAGNAANADSLAVPGDVTRDPVGKIILGLLQHDHHAADGLLFPGETLTEIKPPDFSTTTLNTAVALVPTGLWEGAVLAIDTYLETLGGTAAARFQAFVSLDHCASKPTDGLFRCLVETLKTAVAKAEADKPADMSWGKRFASLGKIFKVFDIAAFGATLADSLISANSGSGLAQFTNFPKPPPTDAKGRPVLPSCLRSNDTIYYVDNACQDALYAVTSGSGFGNTGTNPAGGHDGTIQNDSSQIEHVLFRIASGQTLSQPFFIRADPALAYDVVGNGGSADPALFMCFSRHFQLRDWLPASRLSSYGNKESKDAAKCPYVGPDFPPERDLQANATNWILRQTDGQSYFVDANSILHPIDSGLVYECLAQRFYVLNATTDAEVSRFGTGATASCS
jgi:hypothetical protein